MEKKVIVEHEVSGGASGFSEQAYEAYVERNLRWNFIINICDVGFFNVSMGVASASTILPLFVRQLYDAPWLIGLIPAILALGYGLPGLFAANQAERMERKLPFVAKATIGERVPYLFLAIMTFFFAQSNPILVLISVYFTLAVMSGTGGILTPAWLDMISKEIPLRVRGRFFALSNVVGGVIGAGAAWLVSRILVDFAYPTNFAICFAVAFVATMISFGFLFGNREAPRPAKKETHGLIAYFKRIPGLLKRDRNFSLFIVCRMILTLAGMAAAFYAIYVVDHLHAEESMVGIYTAILLGTQVPANLALGYIGDKWGQRIVMQIVAVSIALAAFLAVLSPDPLVYSLVWVFTAIATSGTFLVNMAMLLEFSTPEDRPTYVAVGLGLGSPVSFAAPLIASWLATTFSYAPLFWISGILGLLALLAVTLFVVDPRKANVGAT